MTAPVGATRHTSVSSRGIRGRNWLVWNPPDDVIGLVYQFSFFILPISASLVVWERTSFVSALILFIVFHLSECLSCSCFVYHQSLLKIADRQCFDKLYLVIDFPLSPFSAFSLFVFCRCCFCFDVCDFPYCMLMLLGVDQSYEVYLPLHWWLM